MTSQAEPSGPSETTLGKRREGIQMTPVFGILGLSPIEMLIIAGIGVMLFGRKLPEVGRYLGKGIVEFKKGVKGLEDEVEGNMPTRDERIVEQPRPPQRVATTAPKFEDSPTNIQPPPM
jgi:sec-independent protein translocase protein TatA